MWDDPDVTTRNLKQDHGACVPEELGICGQDLGGVREEGGGTFKKRIKQHSLEEEDCLELYHLQNTPPPIIYKRLNKTLNPPLEKKHEDDAGYDLRAMEFAIIDPMSDYTMPAGVAFKIPEGYQGIIKARSGLAKARLTVDGGVIDNGYRGEIKMIMVNRDPYK